ncbi:MAG: hypothetical protein IPM23_04040 [Candidatus Melainabacteria bacterium]|nr:hypothetical protein [Candidatus Melainabacteria bacterium]
MWWILIAALFILALVLSRSARRPEPIRIAISSDLGYAQLGYDQVKALAEKHVECSLASEVKGYLDAAGTIIGQVECSNLVAIDDIRRLEEIRARLAHAVMLLGRARKALRQCCKEKKEDQANPA